MTGLLSLRIRWVFAVSLPLLGVLWLSGCENTIEFARYPKDLDYPLRTDPIVPLSAKPPDKNDFFYPPAPGRLEEEIAQFKSLGGETLDPTTMPPVKLPDGTIDQQKTLQEQKMLQEQRKLLQDSLKKTFGTPRQPQVGAATGESPDIVAQLTKLKVRDADDGAPFKTLAQGSKVYRFHCVHCHGLTGDGRGPTGPWVVPHPRDYRSGLFKFISSSPDVSEHKPRRDDLLRVLHNGIENTSMPSFALLDVKEPDSKDKETDLEAAASYVMHLSMRGQVEYQVFYDVIHEGNEFKGAAEMDAKVHDVLSVVVGQWADSSNALVPTEGGYFEFNVKDYKTDANTEDQARKASDEAREQSIRHGYQLFSDPSGDASCIKCHADYGRQANFRYDKWGTMVRPMNLTTGVYRGGRRPIDLYWRIKGGIAPSGMANAKSLTNDKDVWDVVNFVHCLPYPQMLPEDVRNKVYDRPPDDAGKGERAEK